MGRSIHYILLVLALVSFSIGSFANEPFRITTNYSEIIKSDEAKYKMVPILNKRLMQMQELFSQVISKLGCKDYKARYVVWHESAEESDGTMVNRYTPKLRVKSVCDESMRVRVKIPEKSILDDDAVIHVIVNQEKVISIPFAFEE